MNFFIHLAKFAGSAGAAPYGSMGVKPLDTKTSVLRYMIININNKNEI